MIIEKIKRNYGFTVICKCDYCGKEFKRPFSHIKKFGVHFCTILHQRKYSGLKRRGDKNYLWKGGKYKCKDGYVWVYVPNHPNKNKDRCVLEHRFVMEKHIGRYLKKSELVHHKNGIRDDNRIENLELIENRKIHSKNHYLNGDFKRKDNGNFCSSKNLLIGGELA